MTIFDTNCIDKKDKKETIAHFLFQIHADLLHIIATKEEILVKKNGISMDPNKLVKQETPINNISDENRAKVQLLEIAYIKPEWAEKHREEIIDKYMNGTNQ